MKKYVLFFTVLLGVSHGIYAAASHDETCDEVIITFGYYGENYGPKIWYSIEASPLSIQYDNVRIQSGLCGEDETKAIEANSSLKLLRPDHPIEIVLKRHKGGYEKIFFWRLYKRHYKYPYDDMGFVLEPAADNQPFYEPSGKNCKVDLKMQFIEKAKGLHSLFPNRYKAHKRISKSAGKR